MLRSLCVFVFVFKRLVHLSSSTRNLTGIVSVKQASLTRKEAVDISEDDAAIILQKGKAHEGVIRATTET